ncbi:hypothetical protein EH230_12010 [Flavobacterium columnare]|uniref:Uncharacterized protein n=1 Tax=Flavobacterium columnare TaxID=996 RepID=A0A437UD46_9FLAO|nr:hypothetical protein [Flavobacterium columnare]RVU91566.1 hypothetical protein EH230_12010 [Flavobacterium columnare]
MDLLDNIIFNPSKLVISIGEIDAGWMDITLTTNTKSIDYMVSYVCDPVNDLLINFSKLITGHPIEVNPFLKLDNLFHVIHDCEGQLITWVIIKENDKLKILIWENQYDVLDWIRLGFSAKEIYFYEEIPNINDCLIFAIDSSISDFAQTLVNCIQQLKNKEEFLIYKESWGYEFDEDAFKKIESYLEK